MSCESISDCDIQDGYGGQSWLLPTLGVLSPWLHISMGISPVSWLSDKSKVPKFVRFPILDGISTLSWFIDQKIQSPLAMSIKTLCKDTNKRCEESCFDINSVGVFGKVIFFLND